MSRHYICEGCLRVGFEVSGNTLGGDLVCPNCGTDTFVRAVDWGTLQFLRAGLWRKRRS